MAGLKQLKQKRDTVNKTRKVTRAMEAVSAVKMRKSQERALSGRTYASSALHILTQISRVSDVRTHPLFIEVPSVPVIGIVLITSDKGMAGSLNSAVIKQANEIITQATQNKKEVHAICIGRRGADFMRSKGIPIRHMTENKEDDISESDAEFITRELVHSFSNHSIGSWHIVYTNFISTFEQHPTALRALPLSYTTLSEAVTGITPSRGKYAEQQEGHLRQTPAIYTIEPSAEVVLDTLVPALINILVHHALLETKASEHSARMVAMKSATDKATEMSHELLLQYNKVRQAVITNEVSEITSGIEAMK